MTFLGENYLLESGTAIGLFQEIEDLPILDAHNHADIVEIAENNSWPDIWVVEGATDHYVWELMRKRGVPEEKITGGATNRAKWEALASVFPQFVGNPTYEWIHLDLKRRFGIDDIISGDTARAIWETTSARLKERAMRPQELLREMNVEAMCTTDNPTLGLKHHEKAKQEINHVNIFPTWRPDKAMNIETPAWKRFLEKLGEETASSTSNLGHFVDALQATHDYFDKMGCVASDHGIQNPYSHYVPTRKANRIHQKAFGGRDLDESEIRDYRAFMLHQFGLMNAESDWVTQLHIGAVRDYRDKLLEELGADTGGDISTQNVQIAENLRYFLNEFDGKLKIVLYSVDPTHLPTLTTLSRAFPNTSIGAPWWWTDSPHGMETHLRYMSTVDLLSNHAGMVTDSRKLMSFGSRTEMFRRVLCNVVGDMVERGQMPEEPALDLVTSLAYGRPKELFFKKVRYR